MIKLDQIGGGTVRRRFTSGGTVLLQGAQLTGDQIRAMGPARPKAKCQGQQLRLTADT